MCCLHYSISDLIIISAGGGRDEQKCRQSPEASPRRALALVNSFATVFPPFLVHRWHKETPSQTALIFRRWEAAEMYVPG